MNLEQVAKRAKVSTATVSRVLNNAIVVKTSTRARVMKAIEELKYHPNLHARNLAGGKSRTIGMILSNMENPFFFDIYKTVESEARASGYEVVVANTDYNSEQLVASIRLMIGRRVAGLAAIVGGNGFDASAAKMPGILMALGGAIGFALGTVLAKRLPIRLPPITAAAWQIGIGCFPVMLAGLALETTDLNRLTPVGWWLLFYSTVIQFCVAYVSWFAALARLPASVAAIGTMAVPVIGVVASAISLGEQLGPGQIAALALTLAAVVLATRS
jgi:hypothetical protein